MIWSELFDEFVCKRDEFSVSWTFDTKIQSFLQRTAPKTCLVHIHYLDHQEWKKFYLKTIWLKVFKRNIEETSKILASWNFQNFSPILLQYFVADGYNCCAKNNSNKTGRITTRWKGHGIWQIMHEEIGNMQIVFFCFQYVVNFSCWKW